MYHSLVLCHSYKLLDYNSKLSKIILQVSPEFKSYILLEESLLFWTMY